MKNRNCPNKDMCWGYNMSRCEGCVVGEKFSRLTRQIRQLKSENSELRHRVEVAERALLTACVNLTKDEEDNVNMELLACAVYTNYLRKAEKELAEGKKG